MKVKVQGKYYLSADDYAKLDFYHQHYWLQEIDGKKFIDWCPKDLRPTCDKPLDIEIDLPSGRYCFGAGDKAKMRSDHPDWGCTMRVWFTICNAGVRVYSRFSEMASLEDVQAYDASNPAVASAEPVETPKPVASAVEPSASVAPVKGQETPVSKTDTYTSTKDSWWCEHEGITVLETSPVCEDFDFAEASNGERRCYACAWATTLFHKGA